MTSSEVSKHTHKWTCLRDKLLICPTCDTVTEIDDLLANTAYDAWMSAKISILSDQLYANELKKDARNIAYAWVRKNNPDAIKSDMQQGAFL